MHGELRSTRLARQPGWKLHVHVTVCQWCLDSGETRIIKIRIAKKNTENLKNRNVLYTHKFLALRYVATGDVVKFFIKYM